MFRIALMVIIVSGMLGTTSCTKCWNCRKYVTIEVNGEEIETDNYFEEDVCKKREKEELELDGFVCATKR